MLARMSDVFAYAMHRPEIEQLRVECARIQSGAVNQKAINGLAKLIQACDEASKVNSQVYCWHRSNERRLTIAYW